MDQRTRTFKTLASLVGAMIATAAFLQWIDPSPVRSTDTPPASAISYLAQSAVADGVSIRAGQWREIEVVAGAASVTSSPLLAASADRLAAHFLVDSTGRTFGTRRWRRQEPWTGSPSTVRIAVSQAGADRPMTPAQRFCVRALIAALNREITPDGPWLPVRSRQR